MTGLARSLSLKARLCSGWLMLCPMLVAACLALAAQPALAQSVDDQLQRLQRELSDLQRQVYSGGTPPPAAAGDGGGGVPPTQAARIQLQLEEFEVQLQELTGRIEDMDFRVQTVSDRLDRLVADVDLRLRNLEPGGLPPVGAEAPSDGDGGQMAPEAPVAGAPGAAPSPAQPGTIGSISERDLSNFQQQQPAAPAGTPAAPAGGQTAALPGGGPQEQYDYAFGLLRQANYPGAEQAFSAFLEQYPQHALAGNAKYWLGETYYVRGNYQQAAVTFAEGFEAYPNNSKAPDNLLKLGMSLASLGSTQDACGTFSVLLDRYADAPATILSRAQRESQRLSCR
ncbi:MAG: tol-pal system protein YbgF [Kiloniellaceae bacterium]